MTEQPDALSASGDQCPPEKTVQHTSRILSSAEEVRTSTHSGLQLYYLRLSLACLFKAHTWTFPVQAAMLAGGRRCYRFIQH